MSIYQVSNSVNNTRETCKLPCLNIFSRKININFGTILWKKKQLKNTNFSNKFNGEYISPVER